MKKTNAESIEKGLEKLGTIVQKMETDTKILRKILKTKLPNIIK